MALAALDLTAAQQKKIAELRAGLNERLSDLQTRLDAKRSEMAELWRTQRPDRKAILAKHEEMDVLRQQIREESVDFRLAAMDLLTADQLKQLKTWRGRRGPGKSRGLGPCGRGMGWGHGGGRGRGAGGGWGPGWWSQLEDSP
jgi:Spy/CpxP family protein refolding chaperone